MIEDRHVTGMRALRREMFELRYEASIAEQLLLVGGFACLTGIAAQIRIVLPFSPVPITLQTFAVLLAGVVLGMRLGALSQGVYVGAGLVGLPWFQGFGVGLGHLLGPTGGYLIGFVVAAVFIGVAIHRFPVTRRFGALLVLLAVANGLIIYGFGVAWLYLWSTVVTGGSITLTEVIVAGVLPFIPGDVVKLLGAAVIGTMLLPSETELAE